MLLNIWTCKDRVWEDITYHSRFQFAHYFYNIDTVHFQESKVMLSKSSGQREFLLTDIKNTPSRNTKIENGKAIAQRRNKQTEIIVAYVTSL